MSSNLGWLPFFLFFPLISCARHYQVEGMIISIQPQEGMMLVSHRAVPGYMGAMVMPFRARRSEQLQGLEPGAQVQFDLKVTKRNAMVQRIRRKGSSPEGVIQDQGLSLRLPLPREKVRVGSPMPDFQLTDQLGRPIRLSDFLGKVVAINFVYTRCPLPEVCPRLASNFARLQQRFRQHLGNELVLLTVTLDPTHDTPEVLEKYARSWRADPGGWHFLTGSDPVIQKVAASLGLVYWPEEGLLTHTSETGLIGQDGRLLAVISGSSYEVQQLGDLIAQHMEARK